MFFFKKREEEFKKVLREQVAPNIEQQKVEVENEIDDANQVSATSSEASTIFDNIVKEDKTFSEAAFKAKADNIFIQLYTAVMKQDLQRVKHFLSDAVYEKYAAKVKQLQDNNQMQIYDELNVSDTNIVSVSETDDEFKLYVNLLTKYLDYTIAKDTRAFLHGNKDVRTEKRVNLIFTKTKKAKELKAARTCPNCGANLDLNKTGVCAYCGSIFKLNEYDWVLTQIQD